MNNKPDVIMAVMKLSRAMRRHPMRPVPPPPPEHGHDRGCGHGNGHGRGHCHGPHHGSHHMPPMAGGRLLSALKDNGGVSSRELAELLDIRPSSLTELLTRLEQEQLVARTPDENDRRVIRVSLTEKGAEREAQITAERDAHLEKFSACFTDEEAAQFCELCERLAAHLEASDEGTPEGCQNGGNRFGRGMPDGFGAPPEFDAPEFDGDFPPPPPPHHGHGCGHRHGHGHGHCHKHNGEDGNPDNE